MLRIFFLLFLCLFSIAVAPYFYKVNSFMQTKLAFPTWQRFTHAINLSCVLWLILGLPMEVSWQIRWGASSRLLFSNCGSTWYPKLECQSLGNNSSLALSNSHIAYWGMGGVRLTVHHWPIDLHSGAFFQFHKLEYKSLAMTNFWLS